MEGISTIDTRQVRSSAKIASTKITTSESRKKKDADKTATNHDIDLKDSVRESTNSKIERIAQALDNYVRSIQRDLKIQVHSGTGKIMVEVISEEDGKVIREIPPKELLDLAAKIEQMAGTIFNESA